MITINKSTVNLIQEYCKNKPHLTLTIGIYSNGEENIIPFGECGEVAAENRLYEIGSITKIFTASLLAKYVYENKIRLEDKIDQYLNLKEAPHYPTIAQIATHYAGYGEIPFDKVHKVIALTLFGNMKQHNPFIKYDIEWLKNEAYKHALNNKKYSWQYSNFGYAILGLVLAEIESANYKQCLTSFIKNELDLEETQYGSNNPRHLLGYSGKRKCGNWDWPDDAGMAPAGCISSNISDLMKFAKMNLHDEKPYFSLCHQKQAEVSEGFEIGLGWMIKKDDNIIWHNGETGCFHSIVGFCKERDSAVVILSNCIGGAKFLEDNIALSILSTK